MGIERRRSVDGIDHGDDAVETIAHDQVRVCHQNVQHRRRVGEAGRFDDDAGEYGASVVQVTQQPLQSIDEIASQPATQAAGR